jgi:hypothetical protein
LVSFKECEFRNCQWEDIGFSGNRTNVERSFITNPTALISAGYSASNPELAGQKEHVAHQHYRLEGTKAHLARTLLSSHEVVGDDKTYYETARLHDIQQTRARISQGFYELCYGQGFWTHLKGVTFLFWCLELMLLWLIGVVNGWGSSLLRPLLAVLLSFVLFAFIYQAMPVADLINQPWQKSFDITTLAGYANQSLSTQSLHVRLAVGLQLSISVFLYTIFFSTAVARLTRSR